MRKFTNAMREPIELGGIHEVVDEANDGMKAIPIVFVNKSGNNESFTYDNVIEPGTAVRNRMTSPVPSDSRGNSRVVDEDIDGQKALPFVAVTKDESGRFVYADIGGGGRGPKGDKGDKGDKGEPGTGGSGGGVSVFNTLLELQAALPSGDSSPAFVKEDNSWYYWKGVVTQAIPFLSNPSGETNSAGWKSTIIYMTKTVVLSKVHAYQRVNPTALTFQVWRVDDDEKVIEKLAEGVTDSAFDADGFLVGTLATPLTLTAGNSYLIGFNHGANVGVRLAIPPNQRNENEFFKYVGNRIFTPVAGHVANSGDGGAYHQKITITS